MLAASGVVDFYGAGPRSVSFVVGPSFKQRFIPLIKDAAGSELEFDLDLELVCQIAGTEPGGILHLVAKRDPIILIRKRDKPRTMAQNDTLRGVERFIAFADKGFKPTEEEVSEVHEAIIDAVMPTRKNKYNGQVHSIRTSDGTTRDLSRCIEYALNWLASMDVPDEIILALGGDMKKLWSAWYEWRYSTKQDPLFDDENNMNWEQYKIAHPVCELCGSPPLSGDPLERMHIVSGGANIAAYEKPWNWLHAHASHHVPVQHQHGWGPIEKEFPHIIGKLAKARELAALEEKHDDGRTGTVAQESNPGSDSQQSIDNECCPGLGESEQLF